MATERPKLAFGPVPSRRLGHSLGINTIPPKICTYSCIYCQLGRSLQLQTARQEFYQPDEIVQAVAQKVREAARSATPIDYLAFVPDGEPTLDVHLGREISLLKQFGIKIAVITNASLLWQAEVREALGQADWVSVKLDAVTEDVWRRIDRPHGKLRLKQILQGVSEFSHTFTAELTTETMLIQGVNDAPHEVDRIAETAAGLHPATSYLSIPTRPPAEPGVTSATEASLNRAYQLFLEQGLNAEYLIGYEGNAFAWTGNAAEDVLSITAVHPMRAEAVQTLLAHSQADWQVIDTLLAQNKLRRLEYQGNTFYMRTLKP